MTQPLALVTGASRGIGAGVAAMLARRGHDLVITARDRDVGTLDSVAEKLRQHGGHVRVVRADMAREADVERVIAEVDGAIRGLDVLVLNAGVGSAAELTEYPMARFDKQLAVNLRAPYLLVRRLLPLARRAAAQRPNGAKILAIASITGVYSEPAMSAYAASKAALISLCQSINTEASADGVSACAISPAFVDTDMTTWAHEQVAQHDMIAVDDVVVLCEAVLTLSRNAVVPHLVVQRGVEYPYRA